MKTLEDARSEEAEGAAPDAALPFEGKRAPRRGRAWLWLAAAAAAGLAAYLLVARSGPAPAAGGPAARSAEARAVPVVTAAVRKGDMSLYVDGLGTVTALNTVTVRSRVDGQLIDVLFHEGQVVRQGDLLATIDPRPFEVQLHQAEAQTAKDEAALKNANVDLARYQALMAQDAVPRQQLDSQAATVDQYKAAVMNDQAAQESARLNLTYSRITAPITGVVGLRLVDRGNIVHANDTGGVVVITQQQPIAVVFTIPADRLPPVAQEMKAGRALVVEAWDRDLRTRLARGTALAIDNQIDPSTGTVRIKALFANEDSALYPNQFVNARLLVSTLENAVIVPNAALERGPQSTYVYVVKPDSRVEMRTVDPGPTEGDDTSVRKGLTEGDVVVIDGLDKLQPGTLVAPAREGGAPKPKP